MSEPLAQIPIADFVRLLPKTETHLHFEGALPIELLREVDPGVEIPSWTSTFEYDGFEHFLGDLLRKQALWFTSVERYHLAACSLFRRHVAENVRYVEVSVATGALEAADLEPRAVLAAIHAATPAGLDVRIFLGVHHDGHTPKMATTLRDCVTWDELAGLDLHGAEGVPIEPWTAPLWRAARAHGKLTKAHAGEFCGPDFIWRVLAELEPDRIEHGVTAAQDARLVKELIARGVALDMCPISNHMLVPGVRLRTHPIRALFDAGVIITLSTDDPVSFGNTVLDEYVALATERGFSRGELVELAKNGFQVSLLPAHVKRRYCDDLDAIRAALVS